MRPTPLTRRLFLQRLACTAAYGALHAVVPGAVVGGGLAGGAARAADAEPILRDVDDIDFVQLTYNVLDRGVEDELLPLAEERGIAVIANRPFRRGSLFDRFAGQRLPEWAADYDIENWAQFFLKFITSDERITCVIPATSNPDHMAENMGALYGRLPDADARQAMIDYVQRL